MNVVEVTFVPEELILFPFRCRQKLFWGMRDVHNLSLL